MNILRSLNQIWEYDDGKQQYTIHFAELGQTKYEYEIDAMTGDVLEAESEEWEEEDDKEYKDLTAGYEEKSEEEMTAIQEAVQKAIEDAGQLNGGAVVYRHGLDYEDGKKVVSVGFFIPGETKYEYDIDAETGEIVTNEQEAWETEDDKQFEGLLNP